MASRTVRLDDETEQVLDDLVRTTGLSMSALLKQGLLALKDRMVDEVRRTPYSIYEELDLGPGGYASVPSTETRRGAREAIQRKLGR